MKLINCIYIFLVVANIISPAAQKAEEVVEENVLQLHRSICNGRVAEVARRAAADPSLINKPGPDGNSALHIAALQPDFTMLSYLLQNKGNVNIRHPITGRTPLMYATMWGNIYGMKALSNAHASHLLADSSGATALIMAQNINKARSDALVRVEKKLIKFCIPPSIRRCCLQPWLRSCAQIKEKIEFLNSELNSKRRE